MTPAQQTLDRVYGELRDLADSGTVTPQERIGLNEAAAEVRHRLEMLRFFAQERERRAVVFGPAGAVLTG